MTIPRENILAFDPPCHEAGNVTLGPLTVGGAVRLAARGVDLAGSIPRDKVFQAAFVLSGECLVPGASCLVPGVSCLVPGASCLVHSASCLVRANHETRNTNHEPRATNRDYARFVRRYKGGLQELHNAVEAVLNDAFETFVKPLQEQGGTIRLTPHGLGWPLELADFLCSEYGWKFYEAAETPVARAYALLAAARQRHGGKHGGFDYVEREYIQGIKRGSRNEE